MKGKKRLVTIASIAVVLLLGLGIVMNGGIRQSKNESLKPRLHGSWNPEGTNFIWISFNTLYSKLPEGQFEYFYYDGTIDEVNRSDSEIKVSSGEGEGHLDESTQEVFLDSGILANESFKLDSEGNLVMQETGQTFNKFDDSYSTVLTSDTE
ncbi:hypothetical protein AAK899_12170 [Erysipelotrichaceae bacterium 51-3]